MNQAGYEQLGLGSVMAVNFISNFKIFKSSTYNLDELGYLSLQNWVEVCFFLIRSYFEFNQMKMSQT